MDVLVLSLLAIVGAVLLLIIMGPAPAGHPEEEMYINEDDWEEDRVTFHPKEEKSPEDKTKEKP